MEKGGLDGAFLAVYVGQGPLDDAGYARAWEQAMVKFEALKRLTQQMYPNRSAFAASPAEVERVAKTGKRVIMTGVENGYPIGTDLANVKKLYDLGARYITLTHSGNNQLGDSSSAREPLHNGLSPFGKEVVAEMNRLGMMIDVSHIHEKSFWDILAITKAPIIASHSGSKAICDHDRNLTDEQLKALAKNGGVVQTVALGSYLKKEDPARRDAMTKLREELGLPAFGGRGGGAPVARSGGRGGRPPRRAAARAARRPPAAMTPEQRADYDKKMVQYRERMKEIDAKFPGATLKDFVDHLDHAVKVAGIDHVGIGTDFDGGGGIPGFNDDTDAPNVTIELVRRGYTEDADQEDLGRQPAARLARRREGRGEAAEDEVGVRVRRRPSASANGRRERIPPAVCVPALSRAVQSRVAWRLLLRLASRHLVGQRVGLVDLPERLDDRPRVDRHRAVDARFVDVVARQHLDVAVEDQAHQFALLVDDRRPAVAADDVVGADEVERRLQVERGLVLDPARAEVVGRLVLVLRRTRVEAGVVGVRRDLLAVFHVALHRAVRQAQRAGGVRVGLGAVDDEHGLADLRVRGRLHGGHFVVVLLVDGLASVSSDRASTIIGSVDASIVALPPACSSRRISASVEAAAVHEFGGAAPRASCRRGCASRWRAAGRGTSA